MNRHIHKDNDGGFTIIEVLLVMAILAIGIMAVMTMQITATNSNSNAKRITEGTNYMASEFEWLMLQDYDDAVFTVGVNPTRNEDRYTVEHSVAAGPISNTKQVDITVTLGPSGRTVNVTYYKADTF